MANSTVINYSKETNSPLIINIDKLFISFCVLSTYISYFTNSGFIAYSPVILGAILYLLSLALSDIGSRKESTLIFIVWVPYSIWAVVNYLSHPEDGRIFSGSLFTFLIIPFLSSSIQNLLGGNSNKNFHFIYRLLFLFLLSQLVICLGQMSTITFGFGLPINEVYKHRSMVSGTFFNSNDLSTVVLLLSFILLGLERYSFGRQKSISWVLVFLILLITGSRTAIFITLLIFVVDKIRTLKDFTKVVAFLFILILSFYYINDVIDSSALDRIEARIKSLINIFQYGISQDSSISGRLSSYTLFIKNLPSIGLGTSKLHDYYQFYNGQNFFEADLFFKSPHSLIVEVGYWLGLPGLIFVSIPIFFMLYNSRRKFQAFAVFSISTLIPSTIISNFIYFIFILLIFYDKKDPVKT